MEKCYHWSRFRYTLDYNHSDRRRQSVTRSFFALKDIAVALETRTARLTILIDPRKKAVFERLCAGEDLTPSQVVRRMIRSYIEERTGEPWIPPEGGGKPVRRSRTRRGERVG